VVLEENKQEGEMIMVKRILNTTTGKYYKLRQNTTASGTAGQIMGLWSPKRTVATTSHRLYKKEDGETLQEIKKSKYTGYLRGEYFSSEWSDGSPMEGYMIYQSNNGEIYPYGDFSESGNVKGSIDCGDIGFYGFEKTFTKIKK
jgi:hypothetical protein